MPTKSMHMTMDKDFCIGMIKQYGAKEVLTDFDGTDAEAIEIVRNDPREVLVIGECDNQDEKGFCKGHVPTSQSRGAIATITTSEA